MSLPITQPATPSAPSVSSIVNPRGLRLEDAYSEGPFNGVLVDIIMIDAQREQG